MPRYVATNRVFVQFNDGDWLPSALIELTKLHTAIASNARRAVNRSLETLKSGDNPTVTYANGDPLATCHLVHAIDVQGTIVVVLELHLDSITDIARFAEHFRMDPGLEVVHAFKMFKTSHVYALWRPGATGPGIVDIATEEFTQKWPDSADTFERNAIAQVSRL